MHRLPWLNLCYILAFYWLTIGLYRANKNIHCANKNIHCANIFFHSGNESMVWSFCSEIVRISQSTTCNLLTQNEYAPSNIACPRSPAHHQVGYNTRHTREIDGDRVSGNIPGCHYLQTSTARHSAAWRCGAVQTERCGANSTTHRNPVLSYKDRLLCTNDSNDCAR